MDVIVDIDGTLSDGHHRVHHILKEPGDWEAFHAAAPLDEAIYPICEVVKALYATGCAVLLCTGRSEKNRANTCEWLEKHGVPWHGLMMRCDNDLRVDTEVKLEMLQQLRQQGFNPILAIEDRAGVTKMWREAGLICMQVAEGDYCEQPDLPLIKGSPKKEPTADVGKIGRTGLSKATSTELE